MSSIVMRDSNQPMPHALVHTRPFIISPTHQCPALLGFSILSPSDCPLPIMDAEQINTISLALADLSERVQDLRGYL